MTTKEQIKADPNGYKHELAVFKLLKPLTDALKALPIGVRQMIWNHIDKQLEQQVAAETFTHQSYYRVLRNKQVVERASDKHYETYIASQIEHPKLRLLIEKRREAVAIREAIMIACRWCEGDE